MGVLEGDEDDATTTSTASATSELTPRAIDSSSAAATPSMGTTPSDSLDRNVDPKEMNMNNSSDDLQTALEATAPPESHDASLEEVNQATASDSPINQDEKVTSGKGVNDNEMCNTDPQDPPPSYETSNREIDLDDKTELNDKPVSVKRHRRNQSSCGGNKIFKADLGNEQGMVDVNLMPQETNLASSNDMNEAPRDVHEIPHTGDGGDGYREKAICLDKAYKHYGKGGKKIPVLLDLNMSVEQGTIYGLLGPSGCGKTTLLKCIVGKLKLHSGSVTVFGQEPGTPNCGVPGRRVGYMPQELALFGEFNIAETLRYFSRIYGMSYDKYKERIDFLMKFLDLPSRTRQLQAMSGGQQRRASLAVALLHEPELLILDEPTVGVDPLLRTSIWSHMVDLVSPSPMSSTEGDLNKDVVKAGLGRTSIVITTHYIEEARQAHRVGMLRFGKLLEEGSPDSLLARYQKPSLEDVFLELCVRDGDLEDIKNRKERSKRPNIFKKKNKRQSSNERSSNLVNIESQSAQYNNCHKTDPLLSKDDGALKSVVIVPSSNSSTSKHEVVQSSHKRHSRKPSSISNTNQVNNNNKSQKADTNITSKPGGKPFFNMNPGRVNACMIKTFNRMKKRIGFLIYQFVLPAIQVSLFCLAIGQDPKDLPVGIVNGELPGGVPCTNDTFTYGCPVRMATSWVDAAEAGQLNEEHGTNLVCRYLSFLDNSVVNPVYFNTLEEATKAVEDGEAWGVISVGSNFSENLHQRIMSRPDFEGDDWELTIDKSVYDQSSIKVRMDITNQHIAFTLQVKFVEAFENFTKQLVGSCNLPEELVSIPLLFEEPVYGSKELTFTDFMAPGIILTIVHSMALGYSAMIIIIERNEGLLDRTWVAGVTPGEFALAHFLVSLVVNLLQVVVTLVFMINIFQVPAEGSIVWIFLITMLQGICGTSIGLIISAVCETQQDATQIALGIFYPNLILSGIIWPIESMPVVLRYMAYVLPQTFAVEAMRGILLRGWGITYMPVWRGFLVTIAWIVGTYTIFKRLVIKNK